MASVLRIITPGEISVLVDWPLSQGEDHKLSAGPLARRWCNTPKTSVYICIKHLTLIKVRTADPAWLLYNISVYKNRPWKNKKWDQFLERLVSPCHSLSQTLAEFPSGVRSPPSLLILPGLLDPTGEASVSPLLRENGRTPVAYVSGASFLSWSFIGFPHKPSYSASFLHWIFLLSYPHSITLYISN